VDLQQRQTQHGHRRHHTRHETKPVPNGRVVLVPNASTNGGITPGRKVRLKEQYSSILSVSITRDADIHRLAGKAPWHLNERPHK
jgi:hypothetical protein